MFMFAFKKAFPNFMYMSPNSSKPFILVHEVEEVECSGAMHEEKEEEPLDFKGRQDPQNEKVEE
jgi:hypothetical protein